jgi:5-methylcytosine-specific restriction endonuclease McrBC regulatory subunit McrC
MRTTDNNCGKHISKLLSENEDCDIEYLTAIADKNIVDLQIDNPDLLVFPQSLDVIAKSHIFSFKDESLTTFNLMGFVGRNDTRLTICSRFYPNDTDFFLHYMLQKVFSINIFNFDQTKSRENIWDFLLYLFPHYLKKAYAQGLYKAYHRAEYNDTNVKGAIDVKRHIGLNIPFSGKVAYTAREHTYDNPVTQLIRHTIEHIKVHPWGCNILTNDSEIRDIVGKICFVTQNKYKKSDKQKMINANLKPITHPYFIEYKMLQNICLRILRHDKLTFGEEKDKIYGILFDGAWLWEEYLNTILKTKGFEHPMNKDSKNPVYLFQQPNKYPRYPDFYKYNFVLDAKYKHMDINNLDRDDLHQIISYMHIQKAELGGFVHPVKEKKQNPIEIGKLHGYGGTVKLWNLHIPQYSENFADFHCKIKEAEKDVYSNL